MKPSFAFIALVLFAPHETTAQQSGRRTLERLQPCSIQGLTEELRCGQFEVPEVRGAANTRTIRLNVVIVPATTDSVLRDPLVFLAGGGVVPATRYAGFVAAAFPTLRRHRDILLVDQRGTWGSNPLACAGIAPPPPDPIPAVRECKRTLSERADVRAYSTLSAMEDLDTVRAWLGYDRLNLFGVSYGTKASQVYVRQYPDRVRAVALHGVVPLAVSSQLGLAQGAQGTLERVFTLCSKDGDCNAAFPNLRAEFKELIDRLSRAPASVPAARGGEATRLLNDRMLRNAVQASLGTARGIQRLPLAIHNAFQGNYQDLMRLPGDNPDAPSPAPLGVFLSILCSEDIARVDTTKITAATRGTFFGGAPLRYQMRRCAEWPRASLPESFWQPVRSAVPLLALTGELDPITPPHFGEAVTRTMTNSRHIVLPYRSHGDSDPCVTQIIERFLIAGNATGLDTRCLSSTPPPKFELPSAGH